MKKGRKQSTIKLSQIEKLYLRYTFTMRLVWHRICVAIRVTFGGKFKYFVDNRKSIFNSKRHLSWGSINYDEIVILTSEETIYIGKAIESILSNSKIKVKIQSSFEPSQDIGQLHIITSTQACKSLPWAFIIYQTEKLYSREDFTEKYLNILDRAMLIFDGEKTNIEMLRDYGFPLSRLYLIPKDELQQNDFFFLKRAFLGFNLLKFEELVPEYLKKTVMISENLIPKICLSISETYERREDFLESDQHNFVIVEGIRNLHGWIGCGMSYKMLIFCMAYYKKKQFAVCEDDVLFPVNFDLRFDKIIEYLTQGRKKWHLFSGLIADLDVATEILDIETFDGIEYIYINKMTSTVLNIYNQDIFQLVNAWDEFNNNETNSIDRYIEKIPNLVVITTLPFLVGHKEEQMSTLWNSQNTVYSKMIKKSEKMLLEKIKNYKSSLK